jgi:hypothetical protein
MLIFQIEALSDSLLHIQPIVVFLMPLLTIELLFVDGLLYVLMIATLLSLVVIIVTTDLM